MTPAEQEFRDQHVARRARMGIVPPANRVARPLRAFEPPQATTTVEPEPEAPPAPAPVEAMWQSEAHVVAVAGNPVDMADSVFAANLRWKMIALDVAAKHGISYEMIRASSRQRNIILARDEAFYRLRQETAMSSTEIGRKMGHFDHTTVLLGVKRHMQRIAEGTAL